MKRTHLIAIFICLLSQTSVYAINKVEKWRIFELAFSAKYVGNPFTDNSLKGVFINGKDTVKVSGFYDGKNIYRMRFMPDKEGRWSYRTISNLKGINGRKGSFVCTAAKQGNHGPVVVSDTCFFDYADGKPYHPFGTTCYAWVHQKRSLIEQTIKTLSAGYFNKMRMCIFPKDYDWNHNGPLMYPFEGCAPDKWDYTRLNPDYFRNIEQCIARLDSLGIEADLIVFHPYDRWGFSKMDRKTDDLYINYIIARFGAYKNVWWSMANEYDFMENKNLGDWNHYLQLFATEDPYHHLRSIHNGNRMFDNNNQYITHSSIQNENTENARELRKKFNKPVSYDECRYEGNICWSWGCLTAEELVNKFWRGVTNGGYVGHGETILAENPVLPGKISDAELWWSKGGVLRGHSPERIKFLKNIIESAPGHLRPVTITTYWMPYSSIGYGKEYYLTYFNMDQPRSMVLFLPKDTEYKIELIDAWNMTVTPMQGTYSGECLVQLPGKPFTALRITKKN